MSLTVDPIGHIDASGVMHVLQGKSIAFSVIARKRCIHTITVTGEPTAGTFTITCRGGTTDPINIYATAATVQRALEQLDNIGSGNVEVTGGPGPDIAWTVFFLGALRGSQTTVTIGDVTLTGGSSPDVTDAVVSAGGPMFAAGSGTWTASCQLRAGYADSASTVLLDIDCTVSPGAVTGEASAADTDAITTESGRYEIEAYNSDTDPTEVIRVLDGTWTLDRTVVR